MLTGTEERPGDASIVRGLPAALRFLVACLGDASPAPREESTTVDLGDEELLADVYLPRHRPRATVLFVHGMSPRGNEDPRLVNACRALAAAGCRVVAPRYPEVVALRLSPLTARRIVGSVRALSRDERIGLFSVSFSGSLSLLAAGDPRVADRLSALLILGGAARPRAVLEHALGAPDTDPYVWRICLANWLPRLVPDSEPVAEALRVAVHDDSWNREPALYPRALAALSREHQALVASLESPAERLRLGARALPGADIDSLSPMPALPSVRAAVALVHGATDDVVPADESALLYERLRSHGVPSRLTVTRLITHGDTDPRLRTLAEAPSLVRTFAWWFARLAPALLLGLTLGCSGATDAPARSAWLQERLLADNAIWLTRDHALLAGKYSAMARDPYDYLRGTSGLWLADAGRPLTDRTETAFLSHPPALQVLLIGDPHPENLGTVLRGEGPGPAEETPDTPLSIEWVDLDGSAFGPWLVDVRRAALGLTAMVDPLPNCETLCVAAAVGALGRAYAEEMARLADRQPGWDPTDRASWEGEILADLWEEAIEEGAERRRLERNTTLVDGQRRLVIDEDLDAEGAGHLAPTSEEQRTLDRLLASFADSPAAPAGVRVLDAVRRFGSGVASRPAERYVVLWDRGSDGPEDDELLQVREVVSPPWLDPDEQTPAYTASVGGLFEDDAERLATVPRLVWAAPDGDVRVGGVRDGIRSFKIVGWDSWFQDLDHVRVLEKWSDAEVTAGDTAALGEVLGRALAGAHARVPTADGGTGLDAVAADLAAVDDAPEVLAQELVVSATADYATTLADHALFLDLLAETGPLLGADVAFGAQH